MQNIARAALLLEFVVSWTVGSHHLLSDQWGQTIQSETGQHPLLVSPDRGYRNGCIYGNGLIERDVAKDPLHLTSGFGRMAAGFFGLTPDLFLLDSLFDAGTGRFGGATLFNRQKRSFYQVQKPFAYLFAVAMLGTVFL